MATTPEILDAARKLGQMVGSHPASAKLEAVVGKLQSDREAQRCLADYNRLISALSEKEAMGRPIEIDDKRRLDAAQKALAANLTLREFQVAQIELLELMRQVDELIDGGRSESGGGGTPGAAAAPAAPARSPIIMG